MALLNIGKKQEIPQTQPAGTQVPLEKIMELKNKGMNESQIIQTLQQQGFGTNEIYDAMNQSDLKSGAEQGPAQAPPMGPPPGGPAVSFHAHQPSFSDTERIEEVAEVIIDEKWKELTKNLDKILEWKDKSETRFTQIEQNIDSLKHGFEKLHTSILGKVGEYDQNIVNLGTEIKAMEKVFQKLLPTFAENVNELSRITKTMRESKK